MRSSARWIRPFAAIPAVVLATVLAGAVVPAPATADTPEVTISLSPSTVSPGDSVTVTETLTNIHGFTILQPHARILSTPNALPSYTALQGCTGAIGPCTTFTEGGLTGYDAPVGSIAGFTSTSVTFTLTIDPAPPSGGQTVQGQIFGSNYATNPIDGPVLTILTQADVAVSMTGSPKLGLLVPSIEFRVTAKNLGPATMSSATVTTALPAGLSANSSDCTPGTGNVVCTFGRLTSGSSAGATFRVPLGLLSLGLPYSFTARRTASAPQDPNPANDTATVQCTVVTPLLVTCS